MPTLVFSPQAKQKWIQFFNHMESGLADNGPWAALKDFVSKAAESSARLAALFHLFEGKVGDISTEHFVSKVLPSKNCASTGNCSSGKIL